MNRVRIATLRTEEMARAKIPTHKEVRRLDARLAEVTPP